MKENLIDSLVIVAAIAMAVVGGAIAVSVPAMDKYKADKLYQEAMVELTVLVTDMNKLPLFRDMKLVDKWLNIKPEYDAFMEGILFNLEPTDARKLSARIRVAVNKLLEIGVEQ